MATNLQSCNHADEEYIDMEVSSSSNFLSCSTSSPPQSREFEFQMTYISKERESTTSPADELFYKGKLLPLHLPPRLQMVQKLLQNSSNGFKTTTKTLEEDVEEHYSMPLITSFTIPCSNTSTPLESCNISPSESCRVSCELNPDEYFFEWSTELSGFISDNPKKFWSKKLKLIKQSSLGQKIKASRAYLKSLFTKSGCSDESSAKAACNVEDEHFSKGKDRSNKYIKGGLLHETPNTAGYKEGQMNGILLPNAERLFPLLEKKNLFGQIGKRRYPTIANIMNSIEKEGAEDNVNSHRRSFSGAIKRRSPAKCSSSSSSSGASSSSSSSISFNSNGFYELQFLKRSSSATSEIEGSIEAAIAHCKKSQELCSSRKTLNDSGFCALSASRFAACGDQERSGKRICKKMEPINEALESKE
ncbi:unnamed protein product [Ilex paraguariensis]|uniref:Membrane-associated kinase regulator 4 n=1 Tax=Ilex paraguariensis TaxID=185542 RepID=A0ABC8RQE5_9AQUA